MGFPILPVVNEVSELAEKSFVALAGQLLIDGTQPATAISNVFTEYPNLASVFVAYRNQTYTTEEAITMLNSGVEALFVDHAADAESLASSGVPIERLFVLEEGVYVCGHKSGRSFQLSDIVPVSSLDVKKFSSALLNVLKTDRADKLYTTVVIDVYERCLGLVYSSKESIRMAIEKQAGIYYSRSRNEIWTKGLTSGNTQRLLQLAVDCDGDALKFVVIQEAGHTEEANFCHEGTKSCFGSFQNGLLGLEEVLQARLAQSPEGSYTKRLFNDPALLAAKIREEAEEVVLSDSKENLAWEVADLLYFVMTKMTREGVKLVDVERNLNMKHRMITRRKGDAKEKFLNSPPVSSQENTDRPINHKIHLKVVDSDDTKLLKSTIARPINNATDMGNLVVPIIENVRSKGDKALIELAAKFDHVKLDSPVIEAPFAEEYLVGLTPEVKEAIDISMENVRTFHAAQLQTETLVVETQPGVVCSRFSRPIEKVGLYVPGGTAILPSTAFMLGVPAQVAGCKEIIIASPPRKSDGKVSPEVVYVASKVGASKIVLAGGAQAIAAMAYGTESVPKVDKILGPGNQFVTAAKMYVQNDTAALCSIDMPAGPSEVLVICDETADSDFVASDLLSQAEHGVDSQVILIGVQLTSSKIQNIQDALHKQALQLPRLEIVRKCIEHSALILTPTIEQAFEISNSYAPEHLILQVKSASDYLPLVQNAGSVFVGQYSPESCGDYSSGTNHTLPTYGYAAQYSGVNTSTFQKFITSQEISPEGLSKIGPAVMSIAAVEGLDAHKNAVKIRMQKLNLLNDYQ
ncbi:HCL642Cp [Eremothecium sinecaudum]|uniref:Histidine biosynthesis trifunctional protein n=1 Tax=Eremothecium sinecaudum TaxID=45286 RepID=A0A109UXW0_9SACH|nr:HCL642Cp [Eremothecium sinecaudum]AMD19509.1 HCL642Cp [Eremothecium sinecaudum]